MAAAILCEQCGYELTQLVGAVAGKGEGGAPCPECGKLVRESVPEQRTGSPWQQAAVKGGVRGVLNKGGAWLRTMVAVITRPKATFGTMIVSDAAITNSGERALSTRSLVWINLVLASVLASGGGLIMLVSGFYGPEFSLSQENYGLGRDLFLAYLVLPFALTGVLWLLCWIETVGLRTWGKRRGWRVTGDVAWSVVAHSSFGWLVVGLAAPAGLALFQFQWFSASVAQVVRWSEAFGLNNPALAILACTCPLIGLVPGIICFEILVYIGIRRCSYANWK